MKRRSSDTDDHGLSLRIVNDMDRLTLTLSEVEELKWLARQSRIAKWILAGLIAIIAIFGIDHVSQFIKWLRTV